MLAKEKLYKSIHKIRRLFTESSYLQREIELRMDLVRTYWNVGGWAAQGSENSTPNGLFAILSFTNLPMHAKFHCLVAKAMQLRGYSPLIFTNSGNRFGRAYYRLFGFDRLVFWDQELEALTLTPRDLDHILHSLVPAELSVSAAKNLVFHGVQVGKHALSMTCRKRVEGRLDLKDADTAALFREQLALSVRSVLAAERFFEQHPVQKMLVRDPGYTPNGAIYEVALNQGVDCVALEFGQRKGTWVFKRYTPQSRGQHYFSLSPETWKQVRQRPWTSSDDKRVEQEFAGRYRPDSTDDTRRLQSGKQIKSPDAVRAQLGLDTSRKTAVVFSHVAWDAAFFYGEGMFDDFEDWLYQTVAFVSQECPDMNWIVKEHPFNVFKLQREQVKESSEQRLLKPLMPFPAHVRFMPADTDINTQSLFPLVDYVLTVNGTVGMEFPCFGIPAVVAGTGRYSGYGFTIEPQTKEAYFAALRRLPEIPRLGAEAQRLARQHYAALIIGKQVSFEDVAPMELKRLHEAQSDVHDNIHFKVKSLEEFKAARSVNLLGSWLSNSQELDLVDWDNLW